MKTSHIYIAWLTSLMLLGCQAGGDTNTAGIAAADPGVGGESGELRVGNGGYSQCKDHLEAYAETNPAITQTLNDLIPTGLTVHCVDSANFDVDGKTVSLTYAAYGTLMDCPSGCFSSHVCAIVDGNQTLFYSGFSTSAGEVPTACTLNADAIPVCPKDTPGKAHTVVKTPAFKQFMSAQGQDSFRFCQW